MNKIKILSIAVLTTVLLMGCSSSKFKDGTYTGAGKGNNGQIELSVIVESGKVTEIKIDNQEETEGIFEGARDTVIPAIVEKQGTEGVDTVSGATNSSKGIIEAVDNALKSAVK